MGVFNWFKKNLSHVFAIIGIFSTIYFSIFYIPDWVSEYKNERINNVNESLIKYIQELAYNNKDIESENINSLIKAKEIRYNIKYPFTLNELLIQTQERFLDNNYLSLTERQKLVEKLDSSITTIQDNTITYIKNKDKFNYSSYISIIVASLGILISLLAGYSTILKAKSEKQTEISEIVRNAIDFENLVAKIIEGFGFKIYRGSHSAYDPDLIVDSPKGKVGVEIKYSTSKLNKDVVYGVRGVATKYGGKFLLVTNVPLSHDADQQIQMHEMISDNPIDIIQAGDKATLIKNLEEYFKEK